MAFANRATQRLYRADTLEDPGFIKSLFGNPRVAVLFLLVRVYVGWQWLSAGIAKVNSPAWTRDGTALKGFWVSATKMGSPYETEKIVR